jgi:hypothetical protein
VCRRQQGPTSHGRCLAQLRRWWIEKWIHDKTAALECRPRHGTGVLSPMGHGMLKHAKLVSNQAVRRLANQWREKHEKSMWTEPVTSRSWLIKQRILQCLPPCALVWWTTHTIHASQCHANLLDERLLTAGFQLDQVQLSARNRKQRRWLHIIIDLYRSLGVCQIPFQYFGMYCLCKWLKQVWGNLRLLPAGEWSSNPAMACFWHAQMRTH